MPDMDELNEVTRAQETVAGNTIITRRDLEECFSGLGLKAGASVMVHAAMGRLGYVVNGPNDLIDAVFDCIGFGGTMLVSANTSQITDPAEWKSPAVPVEWIDIIRQNMRPFDPGTTLVRGRGILPWAFLFYPDVHRSRHPVKSIAARGARAEAMTVEHPFDESEGKGSPVHKLYLQGGYSLMVGVDLVSCTAIHLAEFLADVPYLYKDNFKALVPDATGKNEFVPLRKYPVTSKYFCKLEEMFKTQGLLTETHLHAARILLLRVRPAVDCVVDILKKDPEYLLKP